MRNPIPLATRGIAWFDAVHRDQGHVQVTQPGEQPVQRRLIDDLPPDVAAAAERGRTRDLEETVRELLDERRG
jgi:hypothetical protein